jgi:hypothetical protein
MNVVLPVLAPALRPERRPDVCTTSVETAFTAIRIEGGLFPAEFLQRVAALTASGQAAQDYGLPPGRTVRDEIGRYWTIAEALWKEYRRNRPREDLPAERTGIERWLVRLLRDVFGHADIAPAPARAVVGDRSFPVTHRVHGGAVPLLLTVADRDLDRSHPTFGEEGRRRAPHATVQEYLNADPAMLWGIVGNGPRLRLLRDNPSLTRPAFVEADLERIFEEGLYSDFATLWLLAHGSRSAPGAGGMAECWLERWRTEGAKTGQRALEKLRAGVTTALRELGSGFVEHPDNDALRVALRDGTLTAEDLHQQLLRLVYRLLFLFTAEERGVLHMPEATPEARALYAQGYAVARLRDRARLKRHYDRYADLWAGLTVTFRALSRGTWLLGLPALGGLFDETQCPDLDAAGLPNARLLAAVHALAYFIDAGSLQRVNYRDMGTEELGSVYESLLELHPVVQVETRPWTFGFVGDDTGGNTRGSARKLSGSYYTPDSLVQELLRTALDPVIERTIRENPADPREALLRLRITDPACGSGHFLLGAARRLADAVARLDSEGDLPDEALRRHALREVVRRCIYGVDRNPLSVELCKTALWIEAIEPGKPLTFLDAHIKCGDSLIGVADLSVLRSGIPDEAFKDLTGDDKGYSRDLRKRNKGERENPTLSLLPEVALPRDFAAAIAALTEAPEDTLEAVAGKRRALADIRSGRAAHDLRVACDLWCAAFFAPKAARPEMRGRDLVPTTDTVWRYLRAPSSVHGPLVGMVEEMRARLHFFHWPLEFPEAFADGGFDCLLGNPPWERIKLQEQEFFAARSESIAKAPNAAARRALIAALAKGDPAERALHRAFEDAKRDAEASSQFVRGCERFPLTAVGDVNTYALFAEAFLRLPKQQGRAGMIVPTGIATDDSTKAFFDEVAGKGRLASFFDFENREGLFAEVHRSFKFALLTLGGETSARYTFFATAAEHLADARRAFTLSADDIRLINPNTRTCPVFRSSADAELTKRIYARIPVFIDEAKGEAGNPWGISFMRMLDMSNDSGLFRTAEQLGEAGAWRDGVSWVLRDGARMVPLCEAKMIHHFDHRWATYEVGGESSRDVTAAEKANPTFSATPRYWVPEAEVATRLAERGWRREWLTGWRDITNATNERTVIAAAMPKMGIGNKIPLFFPKVPPAIAAALVTSLSSLPLDFLARQKIGGTTLNFFYFKQFPVLPPSTYTPPVLAFLLPRILELTFTAEDMRPWAEDLGYDGASFGWDEDRRAHVRAELDAAYAHLYGLSRDELCYILDPADIHGADFPSETFRVLKEKEIRQFGEYRTARLVLAAWDRLTADGTFERFSS